VTTSKHTPKTEQTLRSLGVDIVETSGNDYVEDTKVAVKMLGLKKTLVISADLPLVTSNIIDEVVRRYETAGKPALAVAVPKPQETPKKDWLLRESTCSTARESFLPVPRKPATPKLVEGVRSREITDRPLCRRDR
jgi:molybdopterin-guanine dinucleotide biosynthesis protein A